MNREAQELFETLDFIVGIIIHSNHEGQERIAMAYQEALEKISRIPRDDRGRVYQWVVTCFKRSENCKSTADGSYAGWMLAAVQERVNEQTLPEWQTFSKIIDKALGMLPLTNHTVH